MREGMGKYRGKSFHTGEWVYGYLVPDVRRVEWQILTSLEHVDGYEFNADASLVDPDTVGQFTGFKGIYEGDIVEIRCVAPYAVVYDADYFGFFLKRHNDDLDEPEHIYGDEVHCFDLKVIGNIHDKDA